MRNALCCGKQRFLILEEAELVGVKRRVKRKLEKHL
jgi:hypothetical protein